MAESDVIVENGEVVPFDVETQETGIVPVNNGEIQEVTAAQAVAVLGGTMLVGYGIGKLVELGVGKLANSKLGQKLEGWWNKNKDEAKAKSKKKDSHENDESQDPDMVKITITDEKGHKKTVVKTVEEAKQILENQKAAENK